MFEYVKDILKGILIGVANIIPGVSGGTMAVSMGIYDKILEAVNHLFSNFKKSIFTLLPYLLGMVLGIGALSFVIGYLFKEYPLQTGLTFIGLIFGGIPVLWKKIEKKKLGIPHIIVFLLFFVLIIALQFLGKKESMDTVIQLNLLEVIKLFFIGVIASATMVIPGVSGSMILMLLGYYTPIIDSIKELITNVFQGNWSDALNGFGILIPVGIGIVIGIFAIAKLIGFLLERFPILTYMAILGLVVSSPFAVFMQTATKTNNIFAILTGIFCFVAGFILAYYLGREDTKNTI